jgi:hypothetical protein
MNACPWDSIIGFQSASEFDRFVAWMSDQVQSATAEEVPVRDPYLGATAFHEKWYRHVASDRTWRLVWPDGPFTGLFEPVA